VNPPIRIILFILALIVLSWFLIDAVAAYGVVV